VSSRSVVMVMPFVDGRAHRALVATPTDRREAGPATAERSGQAAKRSGGRRGGGYFVRDAKAGFARGGKCRGPQCGTARLPSDRPLRRPWAPSGGGESPRSGAIRCPGARIHPAASTSNARSINRANPAERAVEAMPHGGHQCRDDAGLVEMRASAEPRQRLDPGRCARFGSGSLTRNRRAGFVVSCDIEGRRVGGKNRDGGEMIGRERATMGRVDDRLPERQHGFDALAAAMTSRATRKRRIARRCISHAWGVEGALSLPAGSSQVHEPVIVPARSGTAAIMAGRSRSAASAWGGNRSACDEAQ